MEMRISGLEGRQERMAYDMDELKRQVARLTINIGDGERVKELLLNTSSQQSHPESGCAFGSNKFPDLDKIAKGMDEFAKQIEQLKGYVSKVEPFGAMQPQSNAHQPTVHFHPAPPLDTPTIGYWGNLPNPHQYPPHPQQNFQSYAQVSKSPPIIQPTSSRKKFKKPISLIPITFTDLLPQLVQRGLLELKQYPCALKPPYPDWYKSDAHCEYHSGAIGHSTEDCTRLKNDVQRLIDGGKLAFEPTGTPSFSTKNG